MRMRKWVAGAIVAGLLGAAVPALVHAEKHQGWGEYDEHHAWRNDAWWQEHHPDWVRAHHPEWARNGAWDEHHHWRNRDWWRAHRPDWAHKHHPEWF